MFRLTVVLGSSMVRAMRGLSGGTALRVLSGNDDTATSVPKVRRNSRRCTKRIYNVVGVHSETDSQQREEQLFRHSEPAVGAQGR
jgi:hypothetical protein